MGNKTPAYLTLLLLVIAAAGLATFSVSHADYRTIANGIASPATSAGLEEQNMDNQQEGAWGGTGIGMTIGKDSTEIEFDCASAEITEPFAAAASGNFSLSGTYTRRSPGPVRVGREAKSQPAEFIGKISGNSMQLKVVLKEANETIGAFSLEKGKTGRIRRCM